MVDHLAMIKMSPASAGISQYHLLDVGIWNTGRNDTKMADFRMCFLCDTMATHNDLGTQGEELAVAHLQKQGYTILDRNWRFGKEEIDIIAQMADELVIVEVKTRNSDFFGQPHEFVSRAKQNHLIRAAHAYVEKHDLDLEVRFDIIGVIINKNGEWLEHLEDAFQPRW